MIARLIFLASIVAMCAGCAAHAVKNASLAAPTETEDGAVKQKTTFWDLPEEMQQSILGGGGGD